MLGWCLFRHLVEPYVLKGDRRKVEHAGAAQFVLAVDVIDIGLRFLRDAAAGFRQHLLAVAEGEGAEGAGGDAGRGQAALQAVAAHVALGDLGPRLIPLEARDLERAGHLAVAAAEAALRLVVHRPQV